mmetsp:Transcript_18796/g.45070  ORF Transcript_18796/g.45070 Transcript_18796/m.45070 type:complete len:235 (+) Transcript_18796:452-1156(+)
MKRHRILSRPRRLHRLHCRRDAIAEGDGELAPQHAAVVGQAVNHEGLLDLDVVRRAVTQRLEASWRSERHDDSAHRVVVADGVEVIHGDDDREVKEALGLDDRTQHRQLSLLPRVCYDVQHRILLAIEGQVAGAGLPRQHRVGEALHSRARHLLLDGGDGRVGMHREQIGRVGLEDEVRVGAAAVVGVAQAGDFDEREVQYRARQSLARLSALEAEDVERRRLEEGNQPQAAHR